MIVQIPFRLRTIVCSLALAQLLSPIFCDMASNGLLDHHVAWLGYWCIHIGPSLPCCSALVRFYLLYNSAVVYPRLLLVAVILNLLGVVLYI